MPLARLMAICVNDLTLGSVLHTYADAPAGEAVAYVGSAGTLEIDVHCGSAKERFKLNPGDPVIVQLN